MEAPSRENLVEHWPDSDDEEATESEGYNGEVWSVEQESILAVLVKNSVTCWTCHSPSTLTTSSRYSGKKKMTGRRACGYTMP